MSTTIEEAERYFTNLWNQSKREWTSGELAAAAIDGALPVEYVLTTVARLIEQKQASTAKIDDAITKLRAVASNQYIYPPESMHVSLLGCTPRYPSKEAFTTERIEMVRSICSQILVGRGMVEMALNGLGITGNQVFIQVFPYDRKWAKMRQDLADALIGAGEHPIVYRDKAPIHLNIMRIVDYNPSKIVEILNTIEQLRDRELGELSISSVAFMITDFMLTAASTEDLDIFSLS